MTSVDRQMPFLFSKPQRPHATFPVRRRESKLYSKVFAEVTLTASDRPDLQAEERDTVARMGIRPCCERGLAGMRQCAGRQCVSALDWDAANDDALEWARGRV